MKLLVAVDESAHSKAVLQSVIAQPWPDDTKVKAVTVVEFVNYESENLSRGIFSGPVVAYDQLISELTVEARKILDEAISLLDKRFGKSNVSWELSQGHAAEIINGIAADWGADLVVIGSHGRRGIGRFILGSVSREVVLQSPCSVEIVKLKGKGDLEAARKHRQRILLPVDDSRFTPAIIDSVVNNKWGEGTEIMLFSVVDAMFDHHSQLSALKAVTNLEEGQKTARDNLEEGLKEKAKKIESQLPGVKVLTEVAIGDPRKKILNEAKKWKADLIVMGSHGRRGIKKIIMGSVSDAVVGHADCSVRIVKLPGRKKKG